MLAIRLPTLNTLYGNISGTQGICTDMINLIGLSREEIASALDTSEVLDIPARQLKMRANQLWHWIYVQGAQDFDCMTTIAKDLRKSFEQVFTLDRPKIITEQISNDGTRKWLLQLPSLIPGQPGPEVEAVYIPEETRGYTLRLKSGGLYAYMFFLPHRHTTAGEEPFCR